MSKRPCDVTVIFSTYRQPEWLKKTLCGFAHQTHRDFEVIVADDGSGEDTAEVIRTARNATGLEIRHVRQRDHGFRKCRILNKAIAAARGEYLIFTDGDCIPQPEFVSRHLELSEPRRFLSGGLLRLPLGLSYNIRAEDIAAGRCFSASWLRDRGMPLTYKLLKLTAGNGFGAVLDRISPATAGWNGHNASGWKADILAANGFDERMGYGGEDRELGERLENAGIRGKRIRHRVTCLHLDHPRGYVDPRARAANLAIRRETRRTRRTRTAHGIAQLKAA
ncbi:MAG: glycosyltransferase [Gammaproteobacteria bacterium]|nr:glycosyltransferase [Gammaproteobacteria bacterium]